MSLVNVAAVKKEITKLEAQLTKAHAVLAALGGGKASTKRKGIAKKATKTRTVAKAGGARAPKRSVTNEHYEKVLEAIGERLPAIELKGKFDGRVLRGLPLKPALAKLRKEGYLETEGQKRQLVYVRTDKKWTNIVPTPASSGSVEPETAEAGDSSDASDESTIHA